MAFDTSFITNEDAAETDHSYMTPEPTPASFSAEHPRSDGNNPADMSDSSV
jgi:hypothetical protein